MDAPHPRHRGERPLGHRLRLALVGGDHEVVTGVGDVAQTEHTHRGRRAGDIDDYAHIGARASLPIGSTVGRFSVVGPDFSANSTMVIGEFCFVGPRVTFFDVILHDWVWIGHDSDIRRGIEFGHHSFVGGNVTIDLFDVDYAPFSFIPPGTTIP